MGLHPWDVDQRAHAPQRKPYTMKGRGCDPSNRDHHVQVLSAAAVNAADELQRLLQQAGHLEAGPPGFVGVRADTQAPALPMNRLLGKRA